MSCCLLCKSRNTSIVFKSHSNLSITSDLRCWPKAVSVWQCGDCGHLFKSLRQIKTEMDKIYQSYQLFTDNDEQDQAIFISGKDPQSRSSLLVESIPHLARLPVVGKMLDIGCNKGFLLKEFVKNNPGWKVSGFEISDSYAPNFKNIHNFENFHSGKLSAIKTRFDLITMVHTLEHINKPLDYLKAVTKLLTPKGLLLMQIPNCQLNAFDILVFEHLSHFFPETIGKLLVKCGLRVVSLNMETVPKEITVVVRQAEDGFTGEIDFSSYLCSLSKQNIDLITHYEKLLQSFSQQKKLVVFGTAEVGTWVKGLLDGRVDFFVDESPWRIGKKHLGIPIKHPSSLTSKDKVVLAMAPIVAKAVYRKWHHIGAEFIYPEALDGD